ncbi:MAG: SusC/RagA family TonB-linked outer membrane protein, partial [bacterium]
MTIALLTALVAVFFAWRARTLALELAHERLTALSMQLRPHFLFNALNAAAELVYVDPDAADRAITALGHLLAHSMRHDGRHEVTLREEIALLQQYLVVERARFGDGLRVELDVAPALLDASVPPLIMQPLVENAIRHGIAPRGTRGVVRIVARRDKARLRLEITDDGIGFQTTLTPPAEGVGIANVRARLRALHGKKQSVDLVSSTGHGTTMTLLLPLIVVASRHDEINARAQWRSAMQKQPPHRQSVRGDMLRGSRAVELSLVLILAVSGTTMAQQSPLAPVTGTVTSAAGAPLQGVSVTVQGSDARVSSNAAGKYFVNAPTNGVLTFVLFGQRPVKASIAGRTRIDIAMTPISYLEEVVVTAYTEQRRADITGAVASINVESASRQTGASVLQRLDAIPGITVAASGSPGSRSTVRIRGIGSFQNNDPLYVIDGVPVPQGGSSGGMMGGEGSGGDYLNFLNPNDITSVQVLKDASAASIYGSRASNGVILIETTKRGVFGPARMTATVRTGMSKPTNGYDNFLITNSLDYFQVVKQSYLNAGLAVPTNIYGDPNNPTVPAYTFAATDTRTGLDAFGRPIGVDPAKYSYPNSLIMPGSAGTNWWQAVFGKAARVGDYNLSIAGAGEDNTYALSFNYFDQDGTAAYNNFKRASVRVNSSFNRGKLQLGENIALAGERHFGGLPDDQGGETGLIGKNILMQPVVPIYDVQGNFASGKAVGLGNNTNPLKFAYEARNNIAGNNRVFGNVFSGLAVTPSVALRSSLGFSVNQGSFAGFQAITPENAEPSFANAIGENQSQATDWTWSNTAKYVRQGSRHSFNLLVGQEATHSASRLLSATEGNLLSTDLSARFIQDALGDAKSKVVNSFGGESALLSFFGKADYNFADKYVASATIRRDGSSRLGPTNRYGTFPAFGLGWRMSKEKFLEGNHWVSDAMLRLGYGVTGNQSIPSGRIVDQYGGSNGDTYYDIAGSNSTVRGGFRQVSLGNGDLKWEENRSTNLGTDLALFDGAVNVILDVYERATNNLLFNPAIPG